MRRWQQALSEIAMARQVGGAAQIEPGKVQQIETNEYHRALAPRGCDLGAALELSAILQCVERGVAGGIERHDLTVQDHLIDRLCCELFGELGKESREIQAASRLQPYFLAVHEGDDAVAVELGLITPLRV